MPEEPTTPDLVELTRYLAEAANAQGFDTTDSYYAPDAVWDTSRTLGQGVGMLEGAAALRRFFEDWRGGYEELEFVFEELLDVGNGVVFALVRQEARPVGSTGVVRQREGWVYVWVDHLIASVTVYPEADIEEGRAAALRRAEERTIVAKDAMTSARIALIHDAFDAVKRRAWDAATSFLAPDAVWESEAIGNFHGRAAIRNFWQDWIGSFDQFAFELEDIVDLGSGVLFVAIRLTGHPFGATGMVDSRQGWIYVWAGEAVTRVITNQEGVHEARAAAERLAEERG